MLHSSGFVCCCFFREPETAGKQLHGARETFPTTHQQTFQVDRRARVSDHGLQPLQALLHPALSSQRHHQVRSDHLIPSHQIRSDQIRASEARGLYLQDNTTRRAALWPVGFRGSQPAARAKMWINPTGNAPPIKFEKWGRTPAQPAAPCSSPPERERESATNCREVLVIYFKKKKIFAEGVLKRAFSFLFYPSLLSFFLLLSVRFQAFILSVLCARACAPPLSESLHQTLLRRLARDFRVDTETAGSENRAMACD